MSVARMQRQQLQGNGGFAQIADVLAVGGSSKGGAVKAASVLLAGSRNTGDTVSYGDENLTLRRIEVMLRKINDETGLSLKDPTHMYEAQHEQKIKSDAMETEHVSVQQELEDARDRLKSLENQKALIEVNFGSYERALARETQEKYREEMQVRLRSERMKWKMPLSFSFLSCARKLQTCTIVSPPVLTQTLGAS